MASTTFAQELFKERELRPFKASQKQQEMAKQSLIYKKKCNGNVHSLLFCKVFSSASSEFATQNERKLLEQQKLKYYDYIRKNFKEKIPEDFESENKLKKALKIKIAEKRENESTKNQQQSFKRPRAPVYASKDKNKNQKEQSSAKKLKKTEQAQQKKIITEKQLSNQLDDEQNFESQIDLINDQIEESQENDYNQV